MQKSDRISREALKNINNNSDLETIQAYLMQDHVPLLPHDQKIVLNAKQEQSLTRWAAAYEKLQDSATMGEVRKWAAKEYSISHTRAYYLVNNAVLCFGDKQILPKKTQRAVQSMLIEKSIEQLKEDYDSGKLEASEYWALHIKYFERLHKLNDLDNPDVVDPKQLAKELALDMAEFTTDPEVLKANTIDIDEFQVMSEEDNEA